jgi:hypothetical protein
MSEFCQCRLVNVQFFQTESLVAMVTCQLAGRLSPKYPHFSKGLCCVKRCVFSARRYFFYICTLSYFNPWSSARNNVCCVEDCNNTRPSLLSCYLLMSIFSFCWQVAAPTRSRNGHNVVWRVLDFQLCCVKTGTIPDLQFGHPTGNGTLLLCEDWYNPWSSNQNKVL